MHPKDVPGLAATLLEWHGTALGLMSTVSDQLGRFKQQADANRKAQAELDEKVEAVKAQLRTSQDTGGDSFGGGGMDGMPVDYDDEKMRKSGRLKGRHMGGGPASGAGSKHGGSTRN